MEIILTHENADFDGVASLLAAHKLYPAALPILPERLNQNVAAFMTLYQNGLPFTRQEQFQAKSVTQVIVVDTQRPVQLRGLPPNLPTRIIDHHRLARELAPNQTFTTELVGANTTLLVEQIQQAGLPLTSLEATLLMLGIYEDTGSLSYGTTTPRDHRAAAWLLEQGAALDTVRRFLKPPLNDEQQALYEQLFRNSDSRTIEGYVVTICSAIVDHYVSEISTVAHFLRDNLDAAVLVVLAQMPDNLQMVCRATVDAIDLGEIARLFGGGGHKRAAAASIHDKNLDEVVAALWREIPPRILPLTRVANLMSYSVQTVDADRRIKDVVSLVRRIGHEGYPVTENGQVIGLLTRRDIDRATEHGLESLTVREVMTGGSVVLRPSDSVWLLEQRMVESGWGQIPVVDDDGKLIGIVTRTDLIKHWARIHPPTPVYEQILPPGQIQDVLGKDAAGLIETIARHAQESGITLYMVGGVIRDLLLRRKNLDIDFVAETSAIELAESLQKRYGGRVVSYRPFNTAKWKLDSNVAESLGLDLHALPDHIDFATARYEFYEHPTALPTVYSSSIKLDLHRRDFTINTLAVQLSPTSAAGHILDYYGGLKDLDNRLIRVLHSLSFVDDPTRILRAVRFERRLNFTIEPRTAELIDSAKPMLERITGERLRNELTLLLRENEPEQGLLNLQQRGVLAAIHPAFIVPEAIARSFQEARTAPDPWPRQPFDIAEYYWHILAAHVPLESLAALCERLLFGQHMTHSLMAARQVVEKAEELVQLRPSQIVERLKDTPEVALRAAWLVVQSEAVRHIIRRFWTEWRQLQPYTNGHVLRQRGLKPGPCFSLILNRLRAAWLDGELHSEDDEKRLLNDLIDRENVCDERP